MLRFEVLRFEVPRAVNIWPGRPAVSSIAATIRAVATGDQDAFSQLYADYVRPVHAIVLGRVPRRDVDDLVQEVFIVAYRRRPARHRMVAHLEAAYTAGPR